MAKRKILTPLTVLLVMLMLLATVPTGAWASDSSAYTPVYGELTIKGRGTYTITCIDEGATVPDINVETDENDVGTFRVKFTEPGRRQYLLYSKNTGETAKWLITFDVTADEENKLLVTIICENPETGEKPMEITYIEETPPSPPHHGSSTKTGDPNRSGIWFCGLAAAVTGVVVLLTAYKRRKKDVTT